MVKSLRVVGWGGVVVVVCKVIFVSNPTFVELCYVVLELLWGCGWGFDNIYLCNIKTY